MKLLNCLRINDGLFLLYEGRRSKANGLRVGVGVSPIIYYIFILR